MYLFSYAKVGVDTENQEHVIMKQSNISLSPLWARKDGDIGLYIVEAQTGINILGSWRGVKLNIVVMKKERPYSYSSI